MAFNIFGALFGAGKKTNGSIPPKSVDASKAEKEVKADTAPLNEEEEAIRNVLRGIDYYRNQSRTYLRLLVMTTLLFTTSALLGGVGLYVMYKGSDPKYFAVTPDGRITPIIPLTQDIIPDDAVANWAAQAVLETFTLSFTNWRQDLGRVKKYYREEAFNELFNYLYSIEGIIPMMESKRMNLVSTLESPAVVIRTGVLEGRKVWDIEFKFALSMEGGSGANATSHLVAKVIVERANLRDHPTGHLIRKLFITPDK